MMNLGRDVELYYTALRDVRPWELLMVDFVYKSVILRP